MKKLILVLTLLAALSGSSLAFAGKAEAARYPCRNWDQSQLTTAKLQEALKKYPQCRKAWAKLTGNPNAKPEDFIVTSQRPMNPSKTRINSGLDGDGNVHYYKWKPKPGTVECTIVNKATAVAATAKCDCLNPSAEGPPDVVQRLPQMVTLTAWAKATAEAKAAVYVRVRTECPGSVTIVTVRVWVYARSHAEARAKARVEQTRVNRGRPSASVSAKATAEARAKIGISIVTKCVVKPVPTTPTTPMAPLRVTKKTFVNDVETTGNPAHLQTFRASLNTTRAFGLPNTGVHYYLGEFPVGSQQTVCETEALGFTPDAQCVTVTIQTGGSLIVIVNRKKTTTTTTPPPCTTCGPPPPPVCDKCGEKVPPTPAPHQGPLAPPTPPSQSAAPPGGNTGQCQDPNNTASCQAPPP